MDLTQMWSQLDKLTSRVRNYQEAQNKLAASILNDIDELRQKGVAISKHDLLGCLDENKILGVVEFLEARVKTYCPEEEGEE